MTTPTNDKALSIKENTKLAAYGERGIVDEIFNRLNAVHPKRNEVGQDALMAVAQIAVMTGANPLPGSNGIHVWKDNKGNICFQFGIDYWRKKVDEAGGLFWVDRPRIMTKEEREQYAVQPGQVGAIAQAALWVDVRKIREEAAKFGEQWTLRQAAEQASCIGYAIVGQNEYAKMGRTLGWTAEKRAEVDMIKRLVPTLGRQEARLVELVQSGSTPAGIVAADWHDTFLTGSTPEMSAEFLEIEANNLLFGDDEPEEKQPVKPKLAEVKKLNFDSWVFGVYVEKQKDGELSFTANQITKALKNKFGEFDPEKEAEYLEFFDNFAIELPEKPAPKRPPQTKLTQAAPTHDPQPDRVAVRELIGELKQFTNKTDDEILALINATPTVAKTGKILGFGTPLLPSSFEAIKSDVLNSLNEVE